MQKNICPNCKVELDEGIEVCPLCHGYGTGRKEGKSKSESTETLKESIRKSRIYAWELSAIIAISAIIVVIIVDLVIVKGLGWSLYAVVSVTGLWLIITSFTFLLRRPVFLGISLALSTLGMLIIFDLLKSPVNWFVGLGLPISVSFWILFAIFLIIIRKLKRKGFNMLAFVLIEISILCIIIEFFGDLYSDRTIFLDWAAITAATLVPLAGILFFIHYRMKRGNDLRSFFHV